MSSSQTLDISSMCYVHLENGEPFNDKKLFQLFAENRESLENGDKEIESELVGKMNKFLLVCTEGSNNNIYWMYEDRSVDDLESVEWNPISSAKAHSLFAKYKYTTENMGTISSQSGKKKKNIYKETNIFSLWSTHPEQRIVSVVTFHPKLAPGFLTKLENKGDELVETVIFNTWTGFWSKLTPIEEFEEELANDRLEKILFHLKMIISRSNETIYDFLLEWMASIVQRPWKKIQIVPIVAGIQGAGKSIFWENFSKIFGIHGLITPDSSLITDKFFGADLAKKVFVTVGETNFRSDTREANALKNQITSVTRKAERKFQDIKIQRDFVNMAWSSNSPLEAFPVEKGSNRRYFLVEADGNKANQPHYFKELNEAFNGDNFLGLRAFYFFLKERELGSVDLNMPPHTEEKADAVMNTFDDFETWWLKCLKAQTYMRPGVGSKSDPENRHWVTEGSSKREVYESFLNTMKNQRKDGFGNEVRFETEFKRILPAIDEGLADFPYSESMENFTMPLWRTCHDHFYQLKGITNPLKETIHNKKRSGEPLSNDRSRLTHWLIRAPRN